MSSQKTYTPQEATLLLQIARQALVEATTRGQAEPLDSAALPPALLEQRACFVTLHTLPRGDLRGCTGTLAARQPLAEEVRHTAVQTAFYDPRFPRLRAEEVPGLHIEISILTPPQPRDIPSPGDLPRLIRPHLDGVILSIGGRRATFLPQVWERVPDPVEFLNLLCQKMQLPPFAWKQDDVQLHTYQTIIIEE